jgi:hypothetical protein
MKKPTNEEIDYITWQVSNMRQELSTLREDLGFVAVRVAHRFSFLFCVFMLCMSSSCVLCAQCWQCLWIVHSWLLRRFSLTFLIYNGCWYCFGTLTIWTQKQQYQSKATTTGMISLPFRFSCTNMSFLTFKISVLTSSPERVRLHVTRDLAMIVFIYAVNAYSRALIHIISFWTMLI